MPITERTFVISIFCRQMSFPHYKILIKHEIKYIIYKGLLSYTSNPKKRTVVQDKIRISKYFVMKFYNELYNSNYNSFKMIFFHLIILVIKKFRTCATVPPVVCSMGVLNCERRKRFAEDQFAAGLTRLGASADSRRSTKADWSRGD
jgi:hypothetical protein